MTRWLALLPLLAAASAPAFAQLPPDKGLAALKPADGLQVELFASEPMLVNPTSIDVDHLGRVWVAEAVNYRRKNFGRPLLRPEGDRIVVLTDKDGDGKADESTVFYQGTDLYGPLGVCVAKDATGPGYKVFVCQSPDILVFEDKDGDTKADGPPKKFLTGIGGFDHDHGVHGVNIGPDGKLYFTIGDAGVTGLQSSDGKGPKWKSNSTDCRAGTVWRCDMDGKNLELIAHNFRNNYECCVNSFGEVWLSDNDDDGNQQTRICFVMPGGNYGYNPRGPGQTHWHEEQPGIVHKTLRTGFGSPTGITFYEGTLLPEKYRGQLLHCDAGPREVRCFHIKPKGAGHELEKEVILSSATDNWFRVSDVCVAPDGSVFVADWYDPGVGGHGMGDWKMGRIYRLTPKGHAGYKVPAVKLDTKEGVLEALASPCLASRSYVMSHVRAMPLQAGLEIGQRARMQTNDAGLTARGVFLSAILQKAPNTNSDTSTSQLSERLMDAFEEQRIRFAHYLVGEEIIGTPIDNKPASLWREYLLHLPFVDIKYAKPRFYELAKLYDGQDIFYRAALNIACGTDPARRDAILADFDKHFPEWNDKVADLVWELRPKSVLPRLEKLLASADLSGPQKARVVDILAANDDPAAGKAMLGLLAADAAAEVKARAIDNLRMFLPTKWSGLAKGAELQAAIGRLLGDPKTAVTGLQLAAAANVTAAVEAIEAVAADANQTDSTRREAVRTLGVLQTADAVDSLMRIGQPANPLSVDVVKALGKHLSSGSKPSPGNSRAMDALQMAITLEKAAPEIKAAALEALAGSRAGTQYLLDLKKRGEMPAEMVSAAGRLLRNSPFQGERAKALQLFPALGKLDPKTLPPPAVLARRVGNPELGKAVMARTMTNEVQCLKCHMVRGAGGQIGPDLSMIGKKGSKENLFESILQPSKAIADQYLSWKIDTADGQAITGLIVAETPTTVTVRDANGKDYPIGTKDIDNRTKSPQSLMPDGLVAGLTEDELVDLVAYLTTLQTAALTPDVWQVVGPFPAETMLAALGKDFGPEKAGYDPTAKFPANGSGKELGWQAVRPTPAGYVDLAALHGAAGRQSASYLATAVDSPADQEAMLLIGNDDGAKLWVNGKQVFQSEATVAATPDQSRVTVRLKKGANTLLFKVANGDHPHGAYLTLLSGQELKTAK